MGGWEVCRRLKSEPLTKDIPVIFMNALNDANNIVASLKGGGVDYIGKPFNMQKVIVRVKTHVTLRVQHRQLHDQYCVIIKWHG
jgi:DNA-binding response OmpR family regulator